MDLFSLLQDLGDRIANKVDNSGSTQLEDDDPVESRFRTVLPSLLEAYFLPDKVKEREILAILKLLRHTVKHFPGVLFHGRAHGVLPVISRIIPLFAEPAANACCECLFDTLNALVSLLHTGERETFRCFFVDATLLVEDLVSVGSFFSTRTSITASTNISVQCFQSTFSGKDEEKDLVSFCGVPSCWQVPNAPGLLIDVTGKARWEPLAESTIKLLSHCLVNESFHVQGLITSSFMCAVGTILCYGTSRLHKVCFDFIRIATTVLDTDLIPIERFILSVFSIFSIDSEELPSYRTSVYDSILAACLLSLYARSQPRVLECTAQAFFDIFPNTVRNSASRDLKVALCNILSLILKQCPSYSSKIVSLLGLIFIPDIISPFSCCLQLALDILGLDSLVSTSNTFESVPRTGKQLHESDILPENNAKRRKLNTDIADNVEDLGNGAVLPFSQHQENASDICQTVQEVIGMLDMQAIELDHMPLENVLAGYCVLVRTFGKKHGTAYYLQILRQFCALLALFKRKGLVGTLTKFQLSILLEVIDSLLFAHATGGATSEILECFSTHAKEATLEILQLPWSRFKGQADTIWKAKSYVLVIASQIKDPQTFNVDQLLELGIRDEDVRVRSAAITSVPVLLRHSSLSRMVTICELLRGLEGDKEQAREALATVIGPMSCIYAAKSVSASGVSFENQEVVCGLCDKRNLSTMNFFQIAEPSGANWSFHDYRRPIISKFLFDEPSYRVQTALLRNLSRLAMHTSEKDLTMSKDIWVKCLEVFPVHQDRGVREVFSSQIHCFIDERVWHCILGHKDASGNMNGDFEVLGKLRHALLLTKDPEVLETLMETVAEIAKVAKNDQLQIFAVVLLIEQLDNGDIAVRVASVKLINEVAAFGWPSDGVDGMIDSMQKGLFEYLCGRLVNRPIIVKEFAEAVMKIRMTDLVRQMVPVVLPKLILEQQHDEKALETLNVLAHQLETTLPLLLLEFCHKVLSVLLLRADGKELMAALHFYEAQTGSDPREIFAAVLPALLDELIRFLGDTGSDEALRRSARVGPMIQEVASIVSGSDDLPSFLRHHFVGLLNSIDRKLLRSEDTASQKQALRCIERLLEMIGAHLSAFVPKIMALLSQAGQQEGLQYESLSVWLSFVRRLARVSPTNLKHFASQIVVALMPCLESEQASTIKGAVGILEELVTNNRSILGEQVRELPLLPSLPALTGVNAILNEVRGSFSLRDQLWRAADGLGHESLNLRYVTATELLKLLSSRRSEITAMILGETPSDADAVSSLVTALLRGCAEESRTSMSQKFKVACAECLGGLGAIDPVKLQVSLRHRSRMEHSDEDLVFELINQHLTRVLRAATDTDVQDAAALAIQELLKLTGCHEARSLSGSRSNKLKNKTTHIDGALLNCGDRLWNRFSEDVKEIITPCLTSKYLLKNSGAPMPSEPIFRQGISFRRWMYLWTRRLLTQVTGQRSSIFIACKGVVRHDMDTAIYLLPYLILDVVCTGSREARSSVTEEILAVLSETGSGNEVGNIKNGQAVYVNNTFCWSGHGEVSTQTIFMLLDNLGQWVDDYKQGTALIQTVQSSKGARSSNAQTKEGSTQLALQCEHVTHLLAAIPKQSLAGASFRCRAYARALLYYESYVRDKSGALNPAAASSGVFQDEDIGFLLRIYGGLDEPDGLSGLAHLQKCASLQDQVLINKKSGNWAEALTCCEQALQMESKSLFWQSGVLDCLVNMGHFQAMVTHVDGLIARMPDFKKEWSMRGVQAAWRLGQWDLLDEYVHGAESETDSPYRSENNATFDLSLAKILQALRSKDHYKFSEQLMHSRLALLAPLAAASMESYIRAYPLIVKLHMLRELEDFFAMAAHIDGQDKRCEQNGILNLVEDWNGRLKMTQPSLWTREPILALRRLLFSATSMQSEVGACWLQYAKLSRASGHYETANRAILQAQAAGAPNAHRERAKLFWDTKKSHRAIDELQQALAKVPSVVLGSAPALGGLLQNTLQSVNDVLPTLTSSAENTDAAKTLLLLGRWVHQTGQKQKEDVIGIYSRVKDLQPKWEKGYFYMAKYYDDLLVDARKRQVETQESRNQKRAASSQKRQGPTTSNVVTADDKPWWNYLPDVILYYAKALHKSHHHLFQALPRLLTLWFEFGSAYHSESLGSDKTLKASHTRVMSIMRGCLKDLPSYQWLASLPQLVSRICHDNDEVVRIVKHIIATVLQAYPQQALWTMAAVSKSAVAERREAAAEIIQAAKNSTRSEIERGVFIQFAVLIDQMIRLCFASVPEKVRTLSLSTSEFSYLKRMMPLGIIMPLQRALTVTLPADGLTNANYNPFPSGDCSTISGIRDEVEVLPSLQRPKKVVLNASDGTEHPFLCKPKDDLRKDARMMEFTAMINRLLSKDPSSRRRKLHIRTFAVIPLTEDCGMVEWVSHTRGLRHILQDLYVACGKFDKQKTNPTVKGIYEESKGKLSGAELLREKILPMFPPVFHKWFLNTFPEPTAWFQSRLAYAHTTAVWSMVGHIVGLGDRHGENILFDSTTGDCVHVDFSCLFDKGLQLEKPELVPFRLTQNMIDGLGITGSEGVFLRTCEITLSVLRTHRETLMSVLETFIHDPLVEWTKSHKLSGTEVRNPHAHRALANIEARLQGVVVGVGAAPSLPLSVEGQAHRLISEAVSHENLGRMYIWWMAWF